MAEHSPLGYRLVAFPFSFICTNTTFNSIRFSKLFLHTGHKLAIMACLLSACAQEAEPSHASSKSVPPNDKKTSFVELSLQGDIPERVKTAARNLQYGLSETEGAYLLNIDFGALTSVAISKDRSLRKAAALVLAENDSVLEKVSDLAHRSDLAWTRDLSDKAILDAARALEINAPRGFFADYLNNKAVEAGPSIVAAAFLLEVLYAGGVTDSDATKVMNTCALTNEGACLEEQWFNQELTTCLQYDKTISPIDGRCLGFQDLAGDMGCKSGTHWSDLKESCVSELCPDGYIEDARSCRALKGLFSGSTTYSHDADCGIDRELSLSLLFMLDGRRVTAKGNYELDYIVGDCDVIREKNDAYLEGHAGRDWVKGDGWSGQYTSYDEFNLSFAGSNLTLSR